MIWSATIICFFAAISRISSTVQEEENIVLADGTDLIADRIANDDFVISSGFKRLLVFLTIKLKDTVAGFIGAAISLVLESAKGVWMTFAPLILQGLEFLAHLGDAWAIGKAFVAYLLTLIFPDLAHYR